MSFFSPFLSGCRRRAADNSHFPTPRKILSQNISHVQRLLCWRMPSVGLLKRGTRFVCSGKSTMEAVHGAEEHPPRDETPESRCDSVRRVGVLRRLSAILSASPFG